MTDLKKLLLMAVAASAPFVMATTSRAADDMGHSMTGVLIDNHCGADQPDEAAAAKHPMKCAMKDSCAASGYQLIVGDKHYKLDDAGNTKAKEYLAKADTTHVTIDGKMDGDVMDVTSIKAAGK